MHGDTPNMYIFTHHDSLHVHTLNQGTNGGAQEDTPRGLGGYMLLSTYPHVGIHGTCHARDGGDAEGAVCLPRWGVFRCPE